MWRKKFRDDLEWQYSDRGFSTAPRVIPHYQMPGDAAAGRRLRLTGNHKVAYKYATEKLRVVRMDDDAVFRALADASRRQLLDRLHQRDGQTLGDLCDGLDMTRQAVAKHLTILAAANLISWQREGREKLHFINPVPINEIAERWIAKFEHRHLTALSALKKKLEGEGHD